ncbi:MAG: hypothetical protein RL643_1084 [Actinomycetota bacterium]|jgi:uncharacterized repeat protein (TIGR03843 family)
MPEDELALTQLLAEGDIAVEMRMPYSSNATFLVRISQGERSCRAIYKPLRGERPLWDFAPGLHRREVAAYRLAIAMGFDFVPITVLRDGPLGEGSVQLLIDADFEQHYFTLFESQPELHDQFRDIAVFDIVANNTDRKSGHVLIDADKHVWGIDHGLCFAADFKLRTVIWEFGGEALPEPVLDAVRKVADTVPLEVASLLDSDEVEALTHRAAWLLEHRQFPVDDSGRRYPWPLV